MKLDNEDIIIKVLMIAAIATGVVTFIYSSKTTGAILVFFGFCLSSLVFIIDLLKGEVKPHIWYLCAMGVISISIYDSISNSIYDSISNSLILAGFGAVLFVIFTVGFIVTLPRTKTSKLEG